MLMKRYLFIAATAAMTLASCTEQVDFTQESLQSKNDAPIAVQFGTYMGKTGTTRAGATGGIVNYDATSGNKLGSTGYEFGVFAYNTGTSTLTDATAFETYKPDFMYNQKVEYSSSAWTYTPLKYWPNGTDAANSANNPSNTASQFGTQYLSFFAYAPYVAVTASSGVPSEVTDGIIALTGNAATGDPKVTYKFKNTTTGDVTTYDITAANNVDLLWGMNGKNGTGYNVANSSTKEALDSNYNVNLTKQTTEEKVNFAFKHALAKLGASDGSGIQVVADIDANSSTPATAGIGTKPDATLITLNSITIKNGESGGSSTLKADGVFDLATGEWTAGSTALTFSTTYNSSTTGYNTNLWETSTAPTYTSDKWSMGGVTTVVQSVLTSGGNELYFIPVSDASLEVTVQYTVRTYDANLATPSGESATCSKVMQTITNSVDISALEPNKYYKIIIHLGLTSVKFAASVSDWEDATSGSGSSATVIWLPSNVVPSSGS